MEAERARELLRRARAEVESELDRLRPRAVGRGPSDSGEQAAELVQQDTDAALLGSLRARLAAIERAERRLAEGSFGISLVSGAPIPDARLEIQPWAEVAVGEEQPVQ